MTITLQFMGAARQVTGSKHLLTVNDRHILLDCGMVQGPRRLANKLNTNLSLDSKSIDAVLLSHAHIDHSGSLPRLVKLGFRGPIHCTHATRDLLEILLPDSAHIQNSDARYLKKRGHEYEPAYDMVDVEKSLKQVKTCDYYEWIQVCPEVRASFIDAGHILGSAQIIIEVDDGAGPLRIAFTGDCGRKNLPILRDPDPIPDCDVLITESTYGNRLHPPAKDLEHQIREFIEDQRGRGGRVLIPAFSVGRTQNVLWYLGNLIHAGIIDPLPIYIDSPLSTKATAIVARHRDLYDEETRAILDSGRNPFYFKGVKCIVDVEESKLLNQLREGIIISASGMCEGGRILHHLKQTISNPHDCILIVGFQAEGTLGRKLLEGYDNVKIFGERMPVLCRVRHLNGLSAHADHKELLAHLKPLVNTVKQTFVVHGEECACAHFADHLAGAGFAQVEIPVHKEKFTLRA